MHIEPGVVDAAKMTLAYGTAAAAATYAAKETFADLRTSGLMSYVVRSAIAALGVFLFFELLPHFAVGISEVHLILGSTLFLILGAAPAAFGLAAGLLIQGAFFAPSDLPMYFANLTTLLVPLFTLQALASRIIPAGTAYVDLKYSQALALSTAYQGGVVAWVAFWVFYGQGFGAETMTSVLTFGGAYMLIVLIEPLADLAILAGAKTTHRLKSSNLVTPRLYKAA